MADISPEYAVLQNEFIKATIKPNGTFDLEILSSGRQYKNLNLLHDEQDAGNQYAFAVARKNLSSLAEYGSMNLILNSPLRAVWQINTIIETVEERTVNQMLDRRLGNDMPRVKSSLTIEIGLSKDSRLIDIAVEIDNHGLDIASDKFSGDRNRPARQFGFRSGQPFPRISGRTAKRHHT